MKIFFSTRKELRSSKIAGVKTDCGPTAPKGRRWAIELPLKKRTPFFG